MASEPLSRFLFEIASDERLGILTELSKRPLKHAEIARALALTGSETTRHLTRLAAVDLVTKNSRGEYEPTPLGETLRYGLPFIEFLINHRDFLLHHSLRPVEPAFIERLGELNRGAFVDGTYQVVAFQENALRATRRRIWVITEQRFEQALPILRDKARQDLDVRVIRPRSSLETERRDRREVERNFSVRVRPEVKLFLAVLDDQAGVCFPTLGGSVDLARMILLTDPSGCRWCEDLFLHYWDRSDPWRTSPGPSGNRA